MKKVIRETEPDADIRTFAKTGETLDFVAENQPEVAFISVENTDGRGYFLIKKMKSLSPQTNVIAVASRCRFEQELMSLRISGYVTERFTNEIVREEMANLRYAASG